MELKVKNTAQAIETAVAYLRLREPDQAPAAGLTWQEKTLYAAAGPMDYAITSKLFSAADWIMEIFQGVAPLSKTVYQITLFNTRTHWFWEGSVKADGTLAESSLFRVLSEEESRQKSEAFLKKQQVEPPKPGGYGH
jgi:hypothetical protein